MLEDWCFPFSGNTIEVYPNLDMIQQRNSTSYKCTIKLLCHSYSRLKWEILCLIVVGINQTNLCDWEIASKEKTHRHWFDDNIEEINFKPVASLKLFFWKYRPKNVHSSRKFEIQTEYVCCLQKRAIFQNKACVKLKMFFLYGFRHFPS